MLSRPKRRTDSPFARQTPGSRSSLWILGAAVLRATAQELLLASTSLPDLTQFVTGKYEVCLKNARWHPLSVGSGKAIESYLECKQHGVWTPPDQVSATHRHLEQDFTTLINADPSEIAYVSSTTTGEGRFLGALGFSEADGKSSWQHRYRRTPF